MRHTVAIVAVRPKIGHGKPIRMKGIKLRVSNINFDPLVNDLATDMRDMQEAIDDRSDHRRITERDDIQLHGHSIGNVSLSGDPITI